MRLVLCYYSIVRFVSTGGFHKNVTKWTFVVEQFLTRNRLLYQPTKYIAPVSEHPVYRINRQTLRAIQPRMHFMQFSPYRCTFDKYKHIYICMAAAYPFCNTPAYLHRLQNVFIYIILGKIIISKYRESYILYYI